MTLVESVEAGARRSGKSAAAFRTISEVASELDVPPHVLRFWESKFPQIKPLKRGGGRRYYRPEDVDLLRRIRELLYKDGYTIKGVQKLLRTPGARPADDDIQHEGVSHADLELDDDDGAPLLMDDEDDEEEAPRAAHPSQPARTQPSRLPTLALAPASDQRIVDPELRAMVDDVLVELEDIRALLLASNRSHAA